MKLVGINLTIIGTFAHGLVRFWEILDVSSDHNVFSKLALAKLYDIFVRFED